jgi:hypothetical protein
MTGQQGGGAAPVSAGFGEEGERVAGQRLSATTLRWVRPS